MDSRFLFGEWRFVGRLMRKKGLLLVFVTILQAGLLISLGIILSITKVTDTIPGQATLLIDGEVLEIKFSPHKGQANAVLKSAEELTLVLSIPGSAHGLSLPVQLVQVGKDNITLRTPGSSESRIALPKRAVPARLAYRSRTLLSAIIEDRKMAGTIPGGL